MTSSSTLSGCLVDRLVRGFFQDGEPVRLLPGWRTTTPALPIVGGGALTAKGRNDLRGGVTRYVVSESHWLTVADKNKSAMPKIILAQSRQCRHIQRMKIEANIVNGPVIRKENLPNGKTRVTTHWIIKGRKTEHERTSYGFTTLAALRNERRESDPNRVDLGIAEDRFSDGSSIFYGLRNSFD